jgi:hypothetical protein
MTRLAWIPAVLAAAGAACSFNGDDSVPQRSGRANLLDAVLYVLGASTDPHGRSSPNGFGVVTNLREEDPRKVEVRSRALGWFDGASWIDHERILVGRRAPPLRGKLIYRFSDGRLDLLGPSPLPRLHLAQEWSPDAAWIASELTVPCKQGQKPIWSCYRQEAGVYLHAADGSGGRVVVSGHLWGWTPDGRLLVNGPNYNGPYQVLDPQSGKRTVVLRTDAVARAGHAHTATLGAPLWSGDRRYVAARVGFPKADNPRQDSFVVVAHADGRVIRFIRSRYTISMFAWSPRGHRLAYTTSGFPRPHELFVVEQPRSRPRLLFKTGARHFDWITWAPDAQALLLDDQHSGAWRLFALSDGSLRRFPRLGGRPSWCCPVNSYAAISEGG